MNHVIPSRSRPPWILIIALFGRVSCIQRAEIFGLFPYSVADGEITISDYPKDAAGEIDFPAEIDGMPVTSIRNSAP